MQTEVIMAGFGGQGLMVIGRLLALAGLAEAKEVTWLPSYGPEMRGGTANCTVIVGDRPIGSPLIPSPKAAVVMNRPSLEKFAPKLKPGGVLVVNSSLIPIRAERDDITEFRIRADDIALEEGSRRAANLVVLGALVGLMEIVGHDTLRDAIHEAFERKPEFLETNLRSFERGYEMAKAGNSDD
ncbi:MAG: 2-oxoacid:acceptor oxidoreductase family protein [Planctomycetota bacterium]